MTARAVMQLLRTLLGLLAACVSATAVAENTTIRIGILAHRADSVQMWKPTAEYLTKAIPGFDFTIVPYDNHSLGPAVERGELDFVVTNPGSYIGLETSYGVTRMLTLRSLSMEQPHAAFGSVMFTRANRADIRELKDLKNKSFMAVDREAFGGFLMGWLVLKEAGINPFSDFSRLTFAGLPQEKIVSAVQRGEVDAGIVRTGVLEDLARKGRLRMDDFRILNPQSVPNFPFALSTRLYPEWPFAKVRHTSESLAQKVAAALLALPEESTAARAIESGGWTVPLDYTSVHELYKTLGVGPYRNYGKVTLADVFKQYWLWLIAVLGALIFLTSASTYVFRLNRGLKQSERRLRETSHELELSNERLEILSNTDALTEIANHRHFQHVLASEWRRAQRNKTPLSLLMIDIDWFKHLNDYYGHAIGDDALKKIAAALCGEIRRPGDLVARYGGEEFSVILPDADLAGAAHVGSRMRAAVEALALPNEQSPGGGNVTISVGVAALCPGYRTSQELLAAADRALYRAKNEGRNRVIQDSADVDT